MEAQTVQSTQIQTTPAPRTAPAGRRKRGAIRERSASSEGARAAAEQRRVRGVERDEDGEIVALCNPFAHWQRVPRWLAVREIEGHRYHYYLQQDGSERKIFVTVRQGCLVLGAERHEIDPDELGDCAETFEGFRALDVVAG